VAITIQLRTTQASLDSDWKSTSSQKIDVQGVAALKSASVGKVNFLDPVTAVVTLSAATLAFRLFEYFKKKDERGVQIDLRTTPATMTDLANVPSGFLVIIDANGKARTEQAKYDKPEEIAQVLAKLFGKAD